MQKISLAEKRILNRGLFRKFSMYGGEKFDDNPTVAEAFTRLGLDYNVEKKPLLVEVDGEFCKVAGQFALVQPPTSFNGNEPTVLSIVSSRYSDIVQNSDIATALEGLTENWPLETAGVADGGGITFAVLRLPDYFVQDLPHEQHIPYLLAADDKTKNGGSGYFMITHIRVTCSNTFFASIAGAKSWQRIYHTHNVAKQFALRKQMHLAVEDSRKEEAAWLDRLFTCKADEEAVNEFFSKVLPFPSMPRNLRIKEQVDLLQIDSSEASWQGKQAEKSRLAWEADIERVKKHWNEMALRMEEFHDTYPGGKHPENGYAAYQAFTAQVNHSELWSGSQTKQNESVVFGRRAKLLTDGFKAARAIFTK